MNFVNGNVLNLPLSTGIFDNLKSIKTILSRKINGIINKEPTVDVVAQLPINEDVQSVLSEDLYITTQISEPFQEYSESDDSDEDIFNNYACIENTAEFDKIRSSMRSTKMEVSDPNKVGMEKDSTRASIRSVTNKDILDTWEETTLEEVSKSGSIIRKGNKMAIVRVHLFLDSLSSKLKIQILQVFDLFGTENRIDTKKTNVLSRTSSVYSYQIHCSVLPVKKFRFKSKIRQGADPMFNEVFYVPKINEEAANSITLRFRLYGSQTSTLNMIGQCLCDLSSIDLSVDTEYNLTISEPGEDDVISTDQISVTGSEIRSVISENIEGHDRNPELMIGLSHNSNSGRLTVEIIRGSSLSKEKNKDFYVKLSLFSSNGQELSHTKTSIRKNTISPVFKESFMFQVALFQMKEVTLMVSVVAKKSIHRKEVVGWVALGYKSSGEEELNHWSEIMEGAKSEVMHSHRLHQNSSSKKFLQ